MALANDMTRFLCLFHHADRARAAVRALEDLSVSRESVQTIDQSALSGGLEGRDTLLGHGVPERDADHLLDGVRHGGVIVSLEAPETQSEAIEKVFHHYSADKIDETELDAAPVAPLAATAPLAASGVDERVPEGTVIPVAEEQLLVGKRAVDRGGVRVFRRTVEEPVRESVDLHNERVVLEYREVNRPATDADVRAGAQQIELVETAEVPVVEKVARVVEEVRVGKVESERTEVVEDSVRHTEVNVEPLADDVARRSGSPTDRL